MFKRIATLALTLLLIGSLSSCIFDPKPAEVKPPPIVVWPDFTEKSDVLFSLEQSYNQRDYQHYVEILDPQDFIFFFSPGDAANGDTPVSWGYTEEIESADRMLNKGGDNPIQGINLYLDFANATWVEFNAVDFPGWYETTVSYNFSIDTENETTYITTGTPRAQFRIRQDGGGKWRLVQWSDIADQ